MKYFPNIAFDDPSNQTFSSELKLVIFLIVAISLGIIINHMSDIAVELNYITTSTSRKSINSFKKIAKTVFWVFSFHKSKDERVKIIKRYLASSRRGQFLEMAENWAWTTEERLSRDEEIIIMHQHICSRIRVISKQTEALYEGFFSEVAFVSSLFTTFFLLVIIALITIPINYIIVLDRGKHFEFSIFIPFILLTYFFAVVFNYSLRRRFRHFCSQVITMALHIYDQEKTKKITENEKDTVDDSDKSVKI